MIEVSGRSFPVETVYIDPAEHGAADAVLITISTGGLDAMAHDLAIPERYGIYATVGDTAGPGGWWTSAATVTFTCDDATSGVATCSDPVVVDTETLSEQGLELGPEDDSAVPELRVDGEHIGARDPTARVDRRGRHRLENRVAEDFDGRQQRQPVGHGSRLGGLHGHPQAGRPGGQHSVARIFDNDALIR